MVLAHYFSLRSFIDVLVLGLENQEQFSDILQKIST